MKKIYLMGILVLGLVVVPGVIQLLLTGEAGILGVGFPLIPAAILVWIFFSKSRGPNLGFTEEIKAGVIEGIISGFVLVVGLLGIWQCMEWEDGGYIFYEWLVNWFPWALVGGFGIGCVLKRKKRALVAIGLAFLFTYVMSFTWWASLFTGYPGVSGLPVNYGEFFATFFGMLAVNIAASSLGKKETTEILLQKRILLSLVLLGFLAFESILGAPFSGTTQFLAAGAVVGAIVVTVPFVLGLLITLGVLILPLGTEFGWTPWSGAPINTLTPRVWILSGLAIMIWILQSPLYSLLKQFLNAPWQRKLKDLVARRREWVIAFVCLAMVSWFFGGEYFQPSPIATFLEQIASIVLIVTFLYLLVFVLSSLLPKKRS